MQRESGYDGMIIFAYCWKTRADLRDKGGTNGKETKKNG